jgi:hypothetical protein
MPVVDSIGELNALLEAADDADDARRVGNRSASVGQDWAFEKTLLRSLPSESFDTALTLTPRVDRYAQVMVRCNHYSVPARFIGHRLRVKLSASTVFVYDRTSVVARHQRAVGKGAKVLDLDHYLEILLRKPGALPGATALVQARASKTFTAEHEAALSVGSTNPDVVALEGRKAAERRGAVSGPDDVHRGGRVVILAEHRPAAVPADERPLPSVDHYDSLLGRETS